MKRKYMNTDKTQWKKPKLTLISEVGIGTNMQTKPDLVLQLACLHGTFHCDLIVAFGRLWH